MKNSQNLEIFKTDILQIKDGTSIAIDSENWLVL